MRAFFGKRRAGFTMIELLVAMAVLALLVVMLMGLVESGTKLWRQSEGRVDSYREARAALGIMSRDLVNALAAGRSDTFLVNGLTNASAFAKLQNVQNIETNTNYAGAALFLASFPRSAQFSTNANENKSDVCEVGYFLAFGKTSAVSAGVGTNGLSDTLNLYRYFLSSDGTYTNILATNGLYANPSPTLTSDKTELLARNITSFRVQAYSTNAAGQPVTFAPTASQPLPVLVEISITAVNQDTAKRLGNVKTAWLDTNSLPIQQTQQTFSTRIRIPGNP